MRRLVKRVIFEGGLVEKVELVPEGSEGLIVHDDCWVEAGCTWNSDPENPVFFLPGCGLARQRMGAT
jgi:hypothetical protein